MSKVWMTRIVLISLMAIGLSACGQKGPLRLPDPPAAPKTQLSGDAT